MVRMRGSEGIEGRRMLRGKAFGTDPTGMSRKDIELVTLLARVC